MNYFSSKAAAEKYAAGRPDFHANTISNIKDFLKIDNKLDNALDIACGTGLSTNALLAIADNVYGTDLSEEMLHVSRKNDKIHYFKATAEQQPFESGIFDLITVSSGVHWFNIDAFLNESNRLLKNGGWLVVYENFFPGEMEEKEDFRKWLNEIYYKKVFPSPPRNKNYDWSEPNLLSKNFTITTPCNFKNKVVFNKQQLINYLLSQSNVISAVESGNTDYQQIEKWLGNELAAFYEDENLTQVFYFGNWIKYLQKI